MELSLILAIGVPFTNDDQCQINIDTLKKSAHRWIYSAQSWLSSPAEKSIQNLHGLQVFCLLAIARHVNGFGINSPFFSAVSLISMAKQMGLDRDRRDYPRLSRIHAELMARLWSTVVELTLISSLESGTSLISLDDFSANQPGNLNDSDIMDESELERVLGTDNGITDMSTQLVLLKSQRLRAEALDIINQGIGPQTSYEAVVELGDQLRKACTEALVFFSAHAKDLGSESAFHRMYIDMYLRKHILLLHRPFMLAAQEDPRFHLSRKICLESCMIIAAYLNKKSDSVGIVDLSRMMMHSSGSLRGALSLDVIVTLAYELITQLQEEGNVTKLIAHDPARELAHAGREPVIRRLEHIREQLAEGITSGNPSLKRFILLSAILTKIKTLEAGGHVRDACLDAVRNAIQFCTKSLEAYLARHAPQSGDVDDATTQWSDQAEVDTMVRHDFITCFHVFSLILYIELLLTITHVPELGDPYEPSLTLQLF